MYCIQGDESKENKTPKWQIFKLSIFLIYVLQDIEFVASKHEQIEERYDNPGEGGSHLKRGQSSEILKRTPKRCQEPALMAWVEIFLTPERYTYQF